MSSSPTIAAIATGPAAGGVGMIRLSGPAALEAAREVAPALPLFPQPRHAYFARLADLDEGVVIHYPGPRSYTGEDVVELMPHGSPRLLSMILERLLQHAGVRLAEPGEFTRRAFLSGRIDLARAEAVAELIAAQSEAGVRSAAAQLSGELSRRIAALKAQLVPLHADVEAVLDFPDEAAGADDGVALRLDAVLKELRSLTAEGARGALARRGAHVVLYGPVNAGKSTLFNALLGATRALVDSEPGTTRDALEATVELHGLQVTLVDTAGLRDGAQGVEARGIEKTRQALAGADLAVLVVPPDLADVTTLRTLATSDILLVAAKCDLGRRAEGLHVSALNGLGVSDLKAELSRRLGTERSQAVALASERHRSALQRALDALERARVAVDVSTLEVVAGETRLSLEALDEITGQDASTELLDAIFKRFCIGK